MRRLAAIVLVLLLAGCTRPPPEVEPAPAPEGAPLRALSTVPLVSPAVPDLDVSIDVVERWVRPADAVVANATARATQFEWYLATRNPLAVVPDAGPFALAPDDAIALDVRREGRHAFALDGHGARLNVSIVEGALPLRLDVRLVEEGGAPRFAPDELLAGRGSVVSLASDLDAAAIVRRVDAMQALARGAGVSFRMTDHVDELGDYDLVVVARDGAGAVGSASARLIYDNRKPEAERSFGPFLGAFQLPPLAGDEEPAVHAWESAHPLRSLEVSVSTTTAGPIPAAVRVTLVDAEGAALGSTEAEGFSLADLPRGDYAFVVEPQGGALVEYRIEARGVWELSPPASFFRDE